MAKEQAFLGLDLEFNQPSRRVIQVGVTAARRGVPASEWVSREWLLDPQEPIAPAIVELTGISDADIAARAVPWEQCAKELSAFINEHECFINPVTWGGGDSEALKNAFVERGIEFHHFGRRWLDVKTMCALDALALGKSAAGGLRSIMGRYGLKFEGLAHRADVDAFNTMRLFVHLLERRSALQAVLNQAKALAT